MADIIQAVIKGFLMGLLLVISVGPVIFTIIKQSVNNGKEGGFSFVAGVWISDIIWVLLSNTFSEFVTGMLDFKKPIGIGGSAILISMGIFYLFFKKVKVHPEDISLPPLQGSDHAKLALQGFLLNTFNPGVMGFWLTSATALAVTHSIRERIIIFSTCIAINISADIGKVILAGKLRSKLTIHNIKVINRVSGFIFLVFGSALLLGVLFFMKKH